MLEQPPSQHRSRHRDYTKHNNNNNYYRGGMMVDDIIDSRSSNSNIRQQQQQQSMSQHQYMKNKISKSHMQVIDSQSSSAGDCTAPSIPVPQQPYNRTPTNHHQQRTTASRAPSKSSFRGFQQPAPHRSLLDDSSSCGGPASPMSRDLETETNTSISSYTTGTRSRGWRPSRRTRQDEERSNDDQSLERHMQKYYAPTTTQPPSTYNPPGNSSNDYDSRTNSILSSSNPTTAREDALVAELPHINSAGLSSNPSSANEDEDEDDLCLPLPYSKLPRVSTLYGRERELEALVQQLTVGGTLTCITGAGGIGKTHLSTHACKKWLAEAPFSRFVVWINAATEWTLRISYLEALQQVLMGKVKTGENDKETLNERGEIIIVAELLHRQLRQQRKKELAKEKMEQQQLLQQQRQNQNRPSKNSVRFSQDESRDDDHVSIQTEKDNISTNPPSACQVFSEDTEDWVPGTTRPGGKANGASEAHPAVGDEDDDEDDDAIETMDTAKLAHLLWDSLLQGISTEYEWIVVVQNVPGGMGGVQGPAGIAPFFFPTADTPYDEWSQGRILFTTRHAGFSGTTCLGPIQSIRIGRLEEDAAVRMLIANAVFDGDREMGRQNLFSPDKERIFQEAQRVGHKLVGPHYLDGSPLMIATAVGHIVSTQITLRQYYSQLKKLVAVALEASGYGTGKVQSRVKRETTMSVCLEQAMDNAQDQGLADILSAAAFVCAENIPLSLLGGDEERVQQLCDMNLLTPVGKEMYSMHRIHQRTAIDAFVIVGAESSSSAAGEGSGKEEGKEEYLCTPDHAVLALRSVMSSFVAEDASTWRNARSCIPHVEALRVHHDLLERKQQLSPNFNHSYYAEIVNKCASTMQWAVKDRPAAFSMFTEALRLQRRLFRYVPSSDLFSTSSSSNMKSELAAALSKTLMSLGSLSVEVGEAHKYYKEALDIFCQTFGEDAKSIELMTLYIALAEVEEKLLEYETAYDDYKKALELYFTIYGHNQNIYADDQKMFLAETLRKIGCLAHYQMHNHAEAELYLEGTVSLLRHVFEGSAEKRYELANALETLGSVCHSQGQMNEARHYYNSALKMKNSIHGDQARIEINNTKYGKKNSNDNNSVCMRINMSQDDITSTASNSSVTVVESIGEEVQLERNLRKENDEGVYDLELVTVNSDARKRTAAEKDKKLAKTLHRLGVMAWNLGSLTQAEDYFEKALSLQHSGYGVDAMNEEIAITLFSLGGLSNDLHNNQVKACAYYDKALDCYYFVHGKDAHNESIAQLLHALGQSSLILKKPQEAKSYLQRALDMKYVLYGGVDQVNADLVATLLDLGKVSRDLQANDDARYYFKSALKGLYIIHGRDAKNAQIASTLTQLGGLSYNSGVLADAKKYFDKCLEMKYYLYGKDAVNDDLASTLNNLGSLNARIKNHEEAFRFYKLALKQYDQIMERPGTEEIEIDDINGHRARTLHNLGLLSYNLQQFDEAERFYAQSLKIKSEVFKDVDDSPDLALTLTKLCSVEMKRGKFELAKYYQDQALKRSHTFLETHQSLINGELLPATPEEAAALMALFPDDIINSETQEMLKAMDFWKNSDASADGEGTKMCWVPFKSHSKKKKKKSKVSLKKQLFCQPERE